jgi:hypothetical protein
MPNIMYHLKAKGYKIFAIFVSADEMLQDMGKEYATRYASCERPAVCPVTCGQCKPGDVACKDDDAMVRKLTTSANDPLKIPWIDGCAGVKAFKRIEGLDNGSFARISEQSRYPNAVDVNTYVATYDLCADNIDVPFFFGNGPDDFITQLKLGRYGQKYGANGVFSPRSYYQRPNCSGAALNCTQQPGGKWVDCDLSKKSAAGCTDSDVGKDGGWRNLDDNGDCIYFADASIMAELRGKLDTIVAGILDASLIAPGTASLTIAPTNAATLSPAPTPLPSNIVLLRLAFSDGATAGERLSVREGDTVRLELFGQVQVLIRSHFRRQFAAGVLRVVPCGGML